MKELNLNEIEMVSGAGWFSSNRDIKNDWDDVREIIREAPDAYDEAIRSTTDMMCRATGKC